MTNSIYFHLPFHFHLPQLLITCPMLLQQHRLSWPSLNWTLCSHKSMPLYMLFLLSPTPKEPTTHGKLPVLWRGRGGGGGSRESSGQLRQNQSLSSLPQLSTSQHTVTVTTFCLVRLCFPHWTVNSVQASHSHTGTPSPHYRASAGGLDWPTENLKRKKATLAIVLVRKVRDKVPQNEGPK